jgi:hypothetical protein
MIRQHESEIPPAPPWDGETDENTKSTFTTIPAANIHEFSVFRRNTLCPL